MYIYIYIYIYIYKLSKYITVLVLQFSIGKITFNFKNLLTWLRSNNDDNIRMIDGHNWAKEIYLHIYIQVHCYKHSQNFINIFHCRHAYSTSIIFNCMPNFWEWMWNQVNNWNICNKSLLLFY
jgi:hypothetical protein